MHAQGREPLRRRAGNSRKAPCPSRLSRTKRERRGTQRVLEDVAKFASPEKVAAYILSRPSRSRRRRHSPHRCRWEVFPFFRMHTLLHCMLADFDEVPVVAAYPGSFNGSSFQLFNRLPADNYYRAIDIS